MRIKKFNHKVLLSSLLISSLFLSSSFLYNVRAAEDNSGLNSVKSEAETIKYESLDFTGRSIDFNNNWKFHYGDLSNAESVSYSDSSWRSVNLPHDYSLELPYDLNKGEAESGYKLGGIGWYRRSFFVPADIKNKRIRIDFGGVYNNASVYINGHLLGEHPYGYTPFSYDLTPYILFGDENIIAVKVNHKFPSSRWYSGSGIYRKVNLTVNDSLAVDKYGVVITAPNLETQKDGNVDLVTATKITNHRSDNAVFTVTQTVYSPDGGQVATLSSEQQTLAAGQSATVSLTLQVNRPQLWDLTTPKLYKVKTEIKENSAVIDTVENDFGFRYFKFSRDGFRLNGRLEKLQGVCMHHDQGALGSRAYHDAIARQVKILKNMGVNSIRVTHNPAADDLIDIANKEGILIVEELFDTWINVKNYNNHDYSSVFDRTIGSDNEIIGKTSENMTWAELDTKTTVARGINAPAIIMWSTGNEILELTGSNNLSSYPGIADKLAKWIKSVDSTRPATIGDNKIKNSNSIAIAMADKIAENGGIVGLNYADENQMKRWHNQKNNWLLYASESSSAINSRGIYNENYNAGNYNQGRTDSGNLTSYDRSRVGWGHTSAQSWYFVAKNDFMAGDYIWTGFDYLGEPTPWNGVSAGKQGNNPPKSSYFGIVDITGFPKDRYYFYRSQWKHDDTTLHILPVWQDNMVKKDRDNNVEVVVYSNADKVELYLQGTGEDHATKVGEKEFTLVTTTNGYQYREYRGEGKSSKAFENLFLTFKVPFKEGKLFAKAYKKQSDGSFALIENTVGRSSVEGFGTAKKFDIKVSKSTLKANGQDLAYVEISLLDDNNREVANAANMVSVNLEGTAASLLALDNGKQNDLTPYTEKSRAAFSGKLLAIVGAGLDAGTVNLTVSADGMESKTVSINVEKDTAAASANEISSYKLSKNYYLPLNGNLTLDDSIEVNLKNGTTERDSVNWDKSGLKLNEAGIYSVSGRSQKYHIPVSVKVNVISRIAAMLNYSTAVELNSSSLDLPSTRPAVLQNAEITKIEYPVQWTDKDNVNLKNEGIYIVHGTSTIFGVVYPVTASVRVAARTSSYDSTNVARTGRLEQSVPREKQSDNLNALNDGDTNFRTVSSGKNSSIWTNYDYAQDGNPDAHIIFNYATNVQIAKAVVYAYEDSWAATKPEDIKIYYAKDGGKFVEVSNLHKEEGNPTSSNKPRLIPITLTFDPVEALKWKVEFKGKAGNVGNKSHKYCVGASEIQFYAQTSNFELNSNLFPANMTINGEKLKREEFAASTVNIADAAAYVENTNNVNNVAWTKIDVNENTVKIILESEDNQKRKTLTVNLKQDDTHLAADNPKRDIDPEAISETNVASQEIVRSHDGVEKAFDNDASTIWHTAWGEDLRSHPDQRYIEVILRENTRIEALRYLPRQDSENNGKVLDYRIEVAPENGEYKAVTTGTWSNDSSWKLAEFEPQEIKKIRLYGVRTAGNPQNKFMSAAEIRLRKTKSDAIELTDSNTVIGGLETSYLLPANGIPVVTPEITVTYSQQTLRENVDYVVKYENNYTAGTAKISIVGIRNYKGTIVKTFEIKDPNRKEKALNLSVDSTIAENGIDSSKIQAVFLKNNEVVDKVNNPVETKKLLIEFVPKNEENKAELTTEIDNKFKLTSNNRKLNNLVVYDISLQDSNGENISELPNGESVKITLAFPADIMLPAKKEDILLYHKHIDDNHREILEKLSFDLNREDKTLTFAMNKFSDVILATAENIRNPGTDLDDSDGKVDTDIKAKKLNIDNLRPVVDTLLAPDKDSMLKKDKLLMVKDKQPDTFTYEWWTSDVLFLIAATLVALVPLFTKKRRKY